MNEKNIILVANIGEDKFSSIANAIKQSEVILIATPPTAIFEVLEHMGNVANKIIIDATNSIGKSPEPYKTVYHCLADKTSADVVKCFNTTGLKIC